MPSPLLFKEYVWLIETLKSVDGLTLREINERWLREEMSGGVELSRTTFNRHRDAVLDVFGVIIDCDKRNGYKYYISNRDVFDEDSVQNWMLSTLSVSNIISESFSVRDRILLENVPSGGEVLRKFVEAMKRSRKISAKYTRYGAEVGRDFELSPYCVKLYRQRWYALCMLRHGNMGVFSLDRFSEVEISDTAFEIDPDFDAAQYFSECFGIVSEVNTPAIRIIIRAFGSERYFMRSLPVHHTQREIVTEEDYSDFEIVMRPTFDFSGYILSRGVMAKIIEPQWLANEIHDMHLEALEMYEE